MLFVDALADESGRKIAAHGKKRNLAIAQCNIFIMSSLGNSIANRPERVGFQK